MIKVNSQNINKNSKYLSSSRFNFLILSINDVLHKLDVICPHSHLDGLGGLSAKSYRLILAREEAEHYENDKGGSVLSIVCLG